MYPKQMKKIEKEFRHSILLCCVTQHGRMMAMDGTSCMKHDLQKLDGLMAFTMWVPTSNIWEGLDGCLGQTVCDMRGSVMFGYVLVSPSSWFLWALGSLEENNVAQSAVLRVLAQYTAQSRCALLRKQHYESTAKLVMAGSNQGQTTSKYSNLGPQHVPNQE